MAHLALSLWPPKTELLGRARRLQKWLAADGLDGALFYQNTDLIYLCGTPQAEAVFVPRRGRPLVLARPPLDRLQTESTLPDLDAMPRGPDLLPRLESHARRKIRRLGLELDVLPVAFFRRLRDNGLAGVDLSDASPRLRQVRAVKSGFELRRMAAAARALDQAFRAAPSVIARGVTELELEAALFARLRAGGHHGLIRMRGFNQEIFFGHVLSGPSGLVPAKVNSPTGGTGVGPGLGQGAGHRKIGPNQLVSVDVCGTHGAYIVDQARIYFTGPVPQAVRRAYDGILHVMDGLTRVLRPGRPAGDAYAEAFRLAERFGLASGFMGLGRDRCPFIGHGVGLELDEWPVLGRGVTTPLAAGMTFALEPRVFLPDVGVVGLEDTFVLTDDGPEPVTLTPRDLVEVSLEEPPRTKASKEMNHAL